MNKLCNLKAEKIKNECENSIEIKSLLLWCEGRKNNGLINFDGGEKQE